MEERRPREDLLSLGRLTSRNRRSQYGVRRGDIKLLSSARCERCAPLNCVATEAEQQGPFRHLGANGTHLRISFASLLPLPSVEDVRWADLSVLYIGHIVWHGHRV